jgi:hypothetical protein
VEASDGAAAVYHVKGLPRNPLTFTLHPVKATNEVVTVDLMGEWSFLVQIRNNEGKEVYGVSAPLSEWIMAKSAQSTYLWHERLRDMLLETNRQYSIEIRCSGPRKDSAVFLEPRLDGGGNELP